MIWEKLFFSSAIMSVRTQHLRITQHTQST